MEIDSIIKKALHEQDSFIPSFVVAVHAAFDEFVIDYIDDDALYGLLSAEKFDENAVNFGVLESLLAASLGFVLVSAMTRGGQAAALEMDIDDILSPTEVQSFLSLKMSDVLNDIVEGTKQGFRQLVDMKGGSYGSLEEQLQAIKPSIGLTTNQVTAVSNYRRQLESRASLGFTSPFDRRIDAVDAALVRSHFNASILNDDEIERLVLNYTKSLMEKRFNDIARTEISKAYSSGRQALWDKAFDSGFLGVQHRKFWQVTPDDKLRATHAVIPKMNPNGVGIKDKFDTPFGMVNGPQDRLVDLINCRCVVVLGI